MGADCKSVGLAYEGSNPSPATPGTAAPPPPGRGRSAVPGGGGAGGAMGGELKPRGLPLGGSNPSPRHARYGGPRPPGRGPFGVQGTVGVRALAVAVRSSGSPPRNSQPKAISTYLVQLTVTSAPSVSADQESSVVPPSASWSATAAWAEARESGSSEPTPVV